MQEKPQPYVPVEKVKPSARTCPVCRGLQLFDAPKYSSGAVLTADDLSSEQNFVRAKMRLHNRHLHGWGTVCGLKVVCDDCEGSVTIMPGYAIDPCGNDLVLVESTRFDVAKAIRDCCNAKRPKLGQCDPFVPPPDPGCKDVETHWCISLRYQERETGQALSLGWQATATGGCQCGHGGCSCGQLSNGCGCGGKSANGGGGCGGKGANGTGVLGTKPASVMGYGLPGCTPRRLVECVEIGLMEHKGPCAPAPLGDRQVWGKDDNASWLAPDSLPGRWLACVKNLIKILEKRMVSGDGEIIAAYTTGKLPANATPQRIRDALCRYRQALLDFIALHDTTRCQMLRVLAEVTVAEIDSGETPSNYLTRTRPTYDNLAAIWIQVFFDCFCDAILPPCEPDPSDDRVPIACVTVRGDRIINICNFACRPYAGAFPSFYYWLSIIPITSFLKTFIASICCAPDFVSKNSPLVNNLLPILDSLDPTQAWRKAFAEDGFALPRNVAKMASEFDPGALVLEMLGTSGLQPVSTAGAIGRPAKDAQEALAAMGVQAQLRETDHPETESMKLATAAAGIVSAGQSVTLLTYGGKVVGIRRGIEGELQPAAPKKGRERGGEEAPADIDAMRAELAALRDRVARLEGGKRK